jgi:hypothetical protein
VTKIAANKKIGIRIFRTAKATSVPTVHVEGPKEKEVLQRFV